MPAAVESKPGSREYSYVAGGGVVVRDQHVLVVHRPSREQVRLPKGHVEPDETANKRRFVRCSRRPGSDTCKLWPTSERRSSSSTSVIGIGCVRSVRSSGNGFGARTEPRDWAVRCSGAHSSALPTSPGPFDA